MGSGYLALYMVAMIFISIVVSTPAFGVAFANGDRDLHSLYSGGYIEDLTLPGLYDYYHLGWEVSLGLGECVERSGIRVPSTPSGFSVVLLAIRLFEGSAVSIELLGGDGYSVLLDRFILDESGLSYIPFEAAPGEYMVRVCGLTEGSVFSGVVRVYGYNNPQLYSRAYRDNAYPIGIVDYGVYLDAESSSYRVYSYRASKVAGVALLNNYYSRDTYVGLALQLNTAIVSIGGSGESSSLFVQSIASVANISSDGYTDMLAVSFSVNIYNLTDFCSTIDREVLNGSGRFITVRLSPICPDSYITLYIRGFEKYYRVDKSIYPLAIVQTIEIQGDTIKFGFGIRGVEDFTYIDEVRFRRINDLYIAVNGSGSSIALPYILEYVIGGPHAKKPLVEPESLDVVLGLYIYRDGMWTIPRSAWSIGLLTFERASNVAVAEAGLGYVRYSVGEPSQKALWSISGAEVPSSSAPRIYVASFDDGGRRYYLSVGRGPLGDMIYLSDRERYVLKDRSAEVFGAVEIVNLSYVLERLYSFRVLTLNGSEVPSSYIDRFISIDNQTLKPGRWSSLDPRDIAVAVIRGIDIDVLDVNLSGGLAEITVNVAEVESVARDLFGMPAPWHSVSVVCSGKVFSQGTTDHAGRLRILMPVQSDCVLAVSGLGLYSLLLLALVALSAVSAYILVGRRG